MPTSGSPISSCIAPKATTIGNVAGAGPPSEYGVPVAAAKSATACPVTSYGSVGGNVRPARDASTAMRTNLPTAPGGRRRPPGRAGRAWAVLVEESAGLAVRLVLAAARAELRELHAVGVVPPVLLGDVVALLAHGARERDLGANVAALAGHGMSSCRTGCDAGSVPVCRQPR